MEIVISEEAVEWYKQELEIDEKATVRFFVRYGGVGGHIPGFSLGINVEEEPVSVHTESTVNDVTFFITEDDAWYFDDRDLIITFNEENEEPQFTYQ